MYEINCLKSIDKIKNKIFKIDKKIDCIMSNIIQLYYYYQLNNYNVNINDYVNLMFDNPTLDKLYDKRIFYDDVLFDLESSYSTIYNNSHTIP